MYLKWLMPKLYIFQEKKTHIIWYRIFTTGSILYLCLYINCIYLKISLAAGFGLMSRIFGIIFTICFIKWKIMVKQIKFS